MSNDPEQEYLSDGLTEDLITALQDGFYITWNADPGIYDVRVDD